MELSKSIKAGMALASISTYDELSRISGVPLNTLKKYASIKAKHSPNMQNLIKLNKVIDLSDYISSSSKDSIISKDNLNKSDNLSLNQKEIVPQLSLNDEKIVPQSKKNAILQLLNDADESKIDYLLQQLSLNQKKDVHKSMSISHDDLSISQEKDVHKSQKNTIFQSSKSEKYTKDDKNVHKSVSPVSKLSVSQGKNVSKSIDELTLHVNIVSHCASAGTSSEIHDVEVYDTDQTMPISKLLFKTPKKAENLRAIQNGC